MIRGSTSLIAHIGYPTHTFKSPLIYNPYFEQAGIDAVVVPMASEGGHFPGFLRALFGLHNVIGALITMPHKVTTVGLLDEATPTVRVAGACNAVKRDAHGRLVGDLFDGEGFVRGLRRKDVAVAGARALVVGTGGVGSAIAASLAGAGVGAITLADSRADAAAALAGRLQQEYPALAVQVAPADPRGHALVVNATPLGMHDGDPLPLDPTRLDAGTFVGEVVMKREITPLLQAARERGCRYQVGVDMLFEQIPAYLEFFGLPSTGADELRALARLEY